jgi:hypothetical protein
MARKKTVNVIILLVIAFAFAGCKAAEEQEAGLQEEILDTGSILVESSPGLAEVYLGQEYKGDTPVSLYNLPVGIYEVTIRKKGYEDFRKTATIKVGRTEEIDAALIPAAEVEKPKAEEPAKKAGKPDENAVQNAPEPAKAAITKINISSFAMYHDFDKMEFTEARTDGSDLFSRKYDVYVHFTALVPAKINVISKPINDAAKEDCIFSDTAVAQLFSGQSLCVKTGTGKIIAVGGTWHAMPIELEIKEFS